MQAKPGAWPTSPTSGRRWSRISATSASSEPAQLVGKDPYALYERLCDADRRAPRSLRHRHLHQRGPLHGRRAAASMVALHRRAQATTSRQRRALIRAACTRPPWRQAQTHGMPAEMPATPRDCAAMARRWLFAIVTVALLAACAHGHGGSLSRRACAPAGSCRACRPPPRCRCRSLVCPRAGIAATFGARADATAPCRHRHLRQARHASAQRDARHRGLDPRCRARRPPGLGTRPGARTLLLRTPRRWAPGLRVGDVVAAGDSARHGRRHRQCPRHATAPAFRHLWQWGARDPLPLLRAGADKRPDTR